MEGRVGDLLSGTGGTDWLDAQMDWGFWVASPVCRIKSGSVGMQSPPPRKNSDIIELLFINRNIDELAEYLEQQPHLDLTGLADSQRNTVLHQLAFEGHIDILRLFLKESRKRLAKHAKKELYQLDPQQVIVQWLNAQNQEGFTALLYASYSGHIDIIRYLVEQGANAQITTKTGLNPLHVAAQRNMLLPLLFFRERIDLNSKDQLSSSPLHWAAYMNSESVVAFLLAQTDLTCLNDPDRDGNTPLMLAVNYGNTRVVRRLLMAGANRHICNNQGKSPLEVATQNSYKTIPRMLDEDYSCCDLLKFYCNLKIEYKPKKRNLTIPIVFLIALVTNTVIINIFFHFMEWYPIYIEVVALGTMALLYLTLLKGPQKNEEKDYAELLCCSEKQLKKLCFQCSNWVPKRGYHCDTCHSCIAQYDHHCTWINNCVGKRNIVRFVFFLIFLILSLGLVGLLSVLGQLCLLLDDGQKYSQFFILRLEYQSSTQRILSMAVLAISLCTSLFVFPVITLLSMQVKNLLLNKTMYESLKAPEGDSPIKSKMKKYSSKVSLRNCQIMCSDNPVYFGSMVESDPYDEPMSEEKK